MLAVWTGDANRRSWQQCKQALAAQTSVARYAGLRSFLQDKAAFDELSELFEPAQKPGQSSRQAFEARESEISGQDQDKIKKEVAWLSHEAQIVECKALRIVLLSRQTKISLAETFYAEQAARFACAEQLLARNSADPPWLAKIARQLLEYWAESQTSFLDHVVSSIRAGLESLQAGILWEELESPENAAAAGEASLIRQIHATAQILQLVLQVETSPPDGKAMLAWYRLMLDVQYFHDTLVLQNVVSLVSLTMLRLSPTLDSLAIGTPTYLLDKGVACELHDLMVEAAPLAPASPTIMAWSILTQHVRELALASREAREIRQSLHAVDAYQSERRRTSGGSEEQSLVEMVHETLDDDSIAYLAVSAVKESNLFHTIMSVVQQCGPSSHLLELLRACLEFIDYQPLLLEAILSIIKDGHLAAALRQDPLLHRKVLLTALSRFPYETMPALRLWHALAQSQDQPPLWLEMENLDTFTCRLPLEFTGYKTVREDEESDYVELVEDFYQIPAGTRGQVLSQGKPLVVAFHYEYSGLAYLGTLLQNEDENVSSVITLISSMLDSDTILAQVDPTQDCVLTIFDIFEKNLHQDVLGLDLFNSCLEFLRALAIVKPERVWPYLSRSGLLSQIGRILASKTMDKATADVLLNCARLTQALMEDVKKNALKRQMPAKALARFQSVSAAGSGVAKPTMEKVLMGMCRLLLNIMLSLHDWRFVNVQQALSLDLLIHTLFKDLLLFQGHPCLDVLNSSITTIMGIQSDQLLKSCHGSAPENVQMALELLISLRLPLEADELARLYAAREEYKIPVLRLIETTGVLQPKIASFLLALNEPLGDAELSQAIWKFSTTTISQKQHGLAYRLIHGSDPRRPDDIKAPSLLKRAMDILLDINAESLEILNFVATAADFFPSVLDMIERHPKFLQLITEWVSCLPPMEKTDSTQLQKASRVLEILSLYVRRTAEDGNDKFAKMVVPHLRQVVKLANSPQPYNHSLHENLRENFARKFSCSVSSMSLPVADALLGYDPAWNGARGFRHEFERAKQNIQLVEAQTVLFEAWKTLLIELSALLPDDVEVQRMIKTTITAGLEGQVNGTMTALAVSRAGLVFTLLGSLIHNGGSVDQSVLVAAWNAVRLSHESVVTALTSPEAEHYRLLLRILFLTLQLQSLKISVGLEILAKLISNGFHALASVLHETPDLVQPSDIGLLTGIMRLCLRMPGMEKQGETLQQIFGDAQTSRAAAALLSWSDQIRGDPIYGELAILFLVEYSSMPALAEDLAVDGVLGYVLSTNVILALQRESFGALGPIRRMYQIWAQGLLPLVTNLLFSVGPPIAAEVSAALNIFPGQLRQAGEYLKMGTEQITLGMMQEVHSLSVIVGILHHFRAAGASAAIVACRIETLSWDWEQVRDDLEAILPRWTSWRSRIVASSERERYWANEDEDAKLGNKLEQRVLKEMQGALSILRAL